MEKSMKETSKMIEIPAGKGVIKLILFNTLNSEEHVILLESYTEKGPCNDEWCQVQRTIRVRPASTVPEGDWSVVHSGEITIAMGRDIYSSIDRGREVVTMKEAKPGSFSSRGFTYIE